MTGAKPPGKEGGGRHPYGPRAVGALVPQVTRAAFRTQPGATAQLVADWPSIVGPALAATTAPRRLVSGALTLACAGPVALELQHLAGPLMERINRHAGRTLVTRLRFVQEAVAAPGETGGAVRRPRLDPVVVEGVPDGPLREALAALGAWVKRDPA